MMEKSLTTSNPSQLLCLLVLAVALCTGCRETSVVVSAAPPPAIDTRFERLPLVLTGIQNDAEVTLWEGLPDLFWEPDLHGHELKRQKTVQQHGYPFYEESRTIPKNEASQITACFSSPESFSAYGGPKKSGEYNPDYCVSWKTSGRITHALVSLENAEVKLYSSNAELYCDLNPAVASQLKQLLQPFRKNRPVTNSGH